MIWYLSKNKTAVSHKQDDEYGGLIDRIRPRRIILILFSIGLIYLGYYVFNQIEINSLSDLYSEYSEYKEYIKFIPIIFTVGIALFLMTKANTMIFFFERGLIYKRFFIKQRYSYSDIYSIDSSRQNFDVRDRYAYDECNLFYRLRSYNITVMRFKNGKSIKLSPFYFWRVNKKIKDLKEGLKKVKEHQ